MMLQFLMFMSVSSSVNRLLNKSCISLLFFMPELVHLGSHLNQSMFSGIRLYGVEKEHCITAQSPASAVICSSLRVIQKSFSQNVFDTEEPVNDRKTKEGHMQSYVDKMLSLMKSHHL